MRQMFQNIEEEEASEINITPMLDVVFIMLIFFIVTASFVKEDGIDVNSPPDTTNRPPPKDKKNILVRIGPANGIWVNARRVDIRSVKANIVRLSAENPEATVVIQPDPAAKNDTLVRVMDASRDAGVFNIAIAE